MGTNEPLQVDTIVLDVDGVLVDVAASYRKAIKETIRKKHNQNYGDSLLNQGIQVLKDAGGFNNDWDVTYGLSLILLAREYGFDKSLPSIESELSNRGGGLESLDSFLGDLLSEDDYESLLDQLDRREHRNLFQELYLGKDLYRVIEEREPEIETDGYIHEEPVLIDEKVVSWINQNFKIGIVTGRPHREAEFALDRIELDFRDRNFFAMEDWDQSKPNPEALLAIGDNCQSEKLLYAGDTLDDVRMVEFAKESGSETQFFGVGLLSGGLTGEQGREKFLDAGADLVLEDVNHLPERVSV